MNKTWSAASVVGRAFANRPEKRPFGSALRRAVAGDGFGIVGSRERGSIPQYAIDMMPVTSSNWWRGKPAGTVRPGGSLTSAVRGLGRPADVNLVRPVVPI